MAIDKNTEASALAPPEQSSVQAAKPLNGFSNHDDARAKPRNESETDEEESRSLAFVYVIVAFLIGLGAIGWAVSAIL